MSAQKSNTHRKQFFYSTSPLIDEIYLYKEHGELPHYFSKLFQYDATVDGYTGDRKKFKSVALINRTHPKNKHIRYLKQAIHIFLNAKKIDILFVSLIIPDTLVKMLAYKLGRGKGKIYFKFDLGVDSYLKNGKDQLIWKNMPIYLRIPHKIFKALPDICTVENKASYERLKSTYYADLFQKDKLYLMPNGFDPDILTECNIIRKTVDKKEKIIITVARLGTYQKNTEMLLEILSNVSLNDWKVYLIGEIEPSFNTTIQQFYVNHPELKESVIFTGRLSQKEIYDYYNRSRVFMLTSRGESYGFVLAEAAYMQNYIITTDVGIASEMKESGFSMYVSDTFESGDFVTTLQTIVNMSENELNSLIKGVEYEKITWEYILRNNEGIKRLLE